MTRSLPDGVKGMNMGSWRPLKDPWAIFSFTAVLLGVVLVIIPQFRLGVASLRAQNSMMYIKSEPGTGTLESIPEATRGVIVATADNVITASRDGKRIMSIRGQGSSRLLLRMYDASGGSVAIEPLPDNRLSVSWGKSVLVIGQQVFAPALFGGGATQPLEANAIDDSTILLCYQDGAYIEIEEIRKAHTLENYVTFLSQSKYIEAVRNSIIVSIAAPILAAVPAVSLAYLFARYDFPGKSVMVTLITMASVSPPFLGGYAWRMLLGEQGVITRALRLNFSIVGLHGVIWVVTWLVFPLVFLLTYDAFISIDSTLVECSYSLGANPGTTLRKIVLPLAMPGIVTGLYMALMTAFTDFGTPYVMSLNLNVLPIMVYKEFLNEVAANYPIASTGSLVMIAMACLVLIAQRISLARRSFASIAARSPITVKPARSTQIGLIVYASVIIGISFIPHVSVTVTSFLKWASGIPRPILTLSNYSRLIQSGMNSVYVSLFLGIIATLLDIIFGVGIAYVIARKQYRLVSSLLNFLVMVPYVIPGTVLGLGFILMFNSPPLFLAGTWIILVLAYFTRKLPYAVKTAEATLYQIHPDLEEAAKSLGANPLRSFFDITLKLMLTGIVSGVTLSFLQIMTEISSTIILYRPPWKPMTAVVFENTTTAGSDFGLASAMTVVLMLILYAPLYFITSRARGQAWKGGFPVAR